MRTLIEDDISDLVDQLHKITMFQHDDPEPGALLHITDKAIDKLIRLGKARSNVDKHEILRSVLRDIIDDLGNHIDSYFGK